jgi:hypothetical protein
VTTTATVTESLTVDLIAMKNEADRLVITKFAIDRENVVGKTMMVDETETTAPGTEIKISTVTINVSSARY